jgi:hypothetical protein
VERGIATANNTTVIPVTVVASITVYISVLLWYDYFRNRKRRRRRSETMNLPKLDEDQELFITECARSTRIFQADLFIVHIGTFTGYGPTKEEAKRAAWLLAKAYQDGVVGSEVRS